MRHARLMSLLFGLALLVVWRLVLETDAGTGEVRVRSPGVLPALAVVGLLLAVLGIGHRVSRAAGSPRRVRRVQLALTLAVAVGVALLLWRHPVPLRLLLGLEP